MCTTNSKYTFAYLNFCSCTLEISIKKAVPWLGGDFSFNRDRDFLSFPLQIFAMQNGRKCNAAILKGIWLGILCCIALVSYNGLLTYGIRH